MYFPNAAHFPVFLCITGQPPGIAIVSWGLVYTKTLLDRFKMHHGSIKKFPSHRAGPPSCSSNV